MGSRNQPPLAGLICNVLVTPVAQISILPGYLCKPFRGWKPRVIQGGHTESCPSPPAQSVPILTWRVQSLPAPPHPACTRAVSSKAAPQCPSVLSPKCRGSSCGGRSERQAQERFPAELWHRNASCHLLLTGASTRLGCAAQLVGSLLGQGRWKLWVCSDVSVLLPPRSSVPFEQRIIAKADK